MGIAPSALRWDQIGGLAPPHPVSLGRLAVVFRGDDHPAVGVLSLAKAGNSPDLTNRVVNDLALEGIHRLELYLALVECPGGHLPGPFLKRLLPALPVPLHIERDPHPGPQLALDGTAQQLLDGVERLPVVADQQRRLLALHGDVHPPIPDLRAGIPVDVHRLEQPLDEVERVLLSDDQPLLLALGFIPAVVALAPGAVLHPVWGGWGDGCTGHLVHDRAGLVRFAHRRRFLPLFELPGCARCGRGLTAGTLPDVVFDATSAPGSGSAAPPPGLPALALTAEASGTPTSTSAVGSPASLGVVPFFAATASLGVPSFLAAGPAGFGAGFAAGFPPGFADALGPGAPLAPLGFAAPLAAPDLAAEPLLAPAFPPFVGL